MDFYVRSTFRSWFAAKGLCISGWKKGGSRVGGDEGPSIRKPEYPLWWGWDRSGALVMTLNVWLTSPCELTDTHATKQPGGVHCHPEWPSMKILVVKSFVKPGIGSSSFDNSANLPVLVVRLGIMAWSWPFFGGMVPMCPPRIELGFITWQATITAPGRDYGKINPYKKVNSHTILWEILWF